MKQHPNNYVKELRVLAEKVSQRYGRYVTDLAEVILDMPDFQQGSACVHELGHHWGSGGLSQHTYEVVSLCLSNGCSSDAFGNKPVEFDTLYLAALYHDIGKLQDYIRTDSPLMSGKETWESSPHKRLIHHISRSAIFWSKTVSTLPLKSLPACLEDDVLHCILSHHGQREFGSPVAPKTREAWILHLSDSMSARMNDCDRIDLVNLQKAGIKK